MQTIYLDISNKGVIPTIYAKQGDVGRKFQVVLTDSGLPYSPASGSAFSVWYAGASGDGNYTEIGDKSAFSVNGNKVTVEMIAQMLSNDGDGVLSLVLNDPNANQISTWNIPYICESVPGADSEEAKDYYTAFSKAVENLPYPDTSLSVAGKAADAAAVGAALRGKAPALDWSHIKWYVMGDSLTAQDNAFTNKRYYDFVQEKTGIQVIVDGVGATGYKAGESEGQSFLDRVKNIPEDVDIVTIFGSGNDLTSTDLTYANAAIYDTLAWIVLNRTGLRVIVVPPTPWRNYDKRGEVWKAYCDRLQLCALTCDFRYLSEVYDCPPFNGKYDSHVEKFFTNDPNGVHPNEEGHKALAPYFYNALLEELALDESVVVSPGGSGGSGGSGGNADQSGLTNTEKTLILSLLQNAVFTSDVSAILAQLETLWSGSGDSGGDTGGTDTPTFYIVTNKLTNVTNSNSAASVASGNSYTATLTVADGFDMESVTVTMGGIDITETAYAGGIVNIASVTGNVVITAIAKSLVDITQDGGTLIIVTVPNVTQDSGTLIIS